MNKLLLVVVVAIIAASICLVGCTKLSSHDGCKSIQYNGKAKVEKRVAKIDKANTKAACQICCRKISYKYGGLFGDPVRQCVCTDIVFTSILGG